MNDTLYLAFAVLLSEEGNQLSETGATYEVQPFVARVIASLENTAGFSFSRTEPAEIVDDHGSIAGASFRTVIRLRVGHPDQVLVFRLHDANIYSSEKERFNGQSVIAYCSVSFGEFLREIFCPFPSKRVFCLHRRTTLSPWRFSR